MLSQHLGAEEPSLDNVVLPFQWEEFCQEIILLNDQINLHLDRLNQVDKWYKKPWVGFVGGVAGTIILIHTIDYTLPQ